MKRGIITIMFAVVFCSLPVNGALITVEIEAVVDSVRDEGDYLEGKIKPGDIILGFYVYESTTPDSSPLDPVQGNYWNYAPPAGIALTVGGFNFMGDPFNIAFHVGIRNNVPHDIYLIGSSNNLPLPNGTPVMSIYWQLNDATASVFSTDALPTTVPSLGEWQTNHLRLETLRMFSIDAHVTSAIPEPCTILLFALCGLMLVRRHKK